MKAGAKYTKIVSKELSTKVDYKMLIMSIYAELYSVVGFYDILQKVVSDGKLKLSSKNHTESDRKIIVNYLKKVRSELSTHKGRSLLFLIKIKNKVKEIGSKFQGEDGQLTSSFETLDAMLDEYILIFLKGGSLTDLSYPTDRFASGEIIKEVKCKVFIESIFRDLGDHIGNIRAKLNFAKDVFVIQEYLSRTVEELQEYKKYLAEKLIAFDSDGVDIIFRNNLEEIEKELVIVEMSLKVFKTAQIDFNKDFEKSITGNVFDNLNQWRGKVETFFNKKLPKIAEYWEKKVIIQSCEEKLVENKENLLESLEENLSKYLEEDLSKSLEELSGSSKKDLPESLERDLPESSKKDLFSDLLVEEIDNILEAEVRLEIALFKNNAATEKKDQAELENSRIELKKAFGLIDHSKQIIADYIKISTLIILDSIKTKNPLMNIKNLTNIEKRAKQYIKHLNKDKLSTADEDKLNTDYFVVFLENESKEFLENMGVERSFEKWFQDLKKILEEASLSKEKIPGSYIKVKMRLFALKKLFDNKTYLEGVEKRGVFEEILKTFNDILDEIEKMRDVNRVEEMYKLMEKRILEADRNFNNFIEQVKTKSLVKEVVNSSVSQIPVLEGGTQPEISPGDSNNEIQNNVNATSSVSTKTNAESLEQNMLESDPSLAQPHTKEPVSAPKISLEETPVLKNNQDPVQIQAKTPILKGEETVKKSWFRRIIDWIGKKIPFLKSLFDNLSARFSKNSEKQPSVIKKPDIVNQTASVSYKANKANEGKSYSKQK